MTGKNLFLVLLGIILLLSGLVAILGLVAKTSEHNIPREHICLSSPHHQESYDSIWDRVVRKTGIDDRTAALTRISLEIEPDATLDTMDLQFTAKKNGVEGYYAVWYRQDGSACGWMDGLAYPGILPDFEPVHVVNPGNVFREIREIPVSGMNLSGRRIQIRGDCTQPMSATTRDAVRYEADYLWTNRSLVPAGTGSYGNAHFCLDYSQLNCTILREGMTSCRKEHAARIFYPYPAGTCQCAGYNNR